MKIIVLISFILLFVSLVSTYSLSRSDHLCNVVDCQWSEWKCGTCSQYSCREMCTRTKKVEAENGGKDCEGDVEMERECKNSGQTCYDFPIEYDACKECRLQGKDIACRVNKAVCIGKKYGIHNMYPANGHYFLHCSDDGPWCKPCAVDTLVFNAKCGQCEKTRDGPCTGSRRDFEDDELW